jgi:Tol biopolymer transport system component/DNA-binding winged helix-turn-helix (wHTH) protein
VFAVPSRVSAIRAWRFGVFEVDAQSGELRRSGTLIKLREQPARILLLLLEHAGEMVTREQLRERLWPSDTFVDFDHSLNSAVMKLREALGDSADKPLYIETIPRKGYRFIAPVLDRPPIKSLPAPDASADPSTNHPSSNVAISPSAENLRLAAVEAGSVEPSGEQAAHHPLRPRVRLPLRLRVLALSALLLLPLLIIAGWIARRAASHPPPDTQQATYPNLRIVPVTNVRGYVGGAVFSPDGGQIAFTWTGPEGRRSDLYVQIIGGETPLRLTHLPSGFLDVPQWSPDGREIAFTWCGGTSEGVYLVPALGGAERKLTGIDCRYSYAGSPIWTPDGQHMLLLDQCTPAGPHGIVLFSFATGEKRCLTAPDSANADDFSPALSPDGTTVAFARVTSVGVGEIYTVSVSGGAPRRLTSESHGVAPLMWTPDGRYIVFESDRGVLARIWRVPAVGGAIEPEMRYPRVGSFSRDGRRFVYTDDLGGEPPSTWRADLSAPGGRVLKNRDLNTSPYRAYAAQPSPDGAQIAFVSGRAGADEIWSSSAEGDHPLQLTSLGRLSGTPRWSPDGKWIAFDSRPNLHSQIYLIDAEGRNLHMITAGEHDNVVPSWSRDGKWIYFSSMRTGSYQIWKHSLENGSEMQLTQQGGFFPFASYDGRTIYYSKFHQAGIWSMPVNGGPVNGYQESLVIAGKPQIGYHGAWAVTEAGLYLLDADAEPRSTIQFYSFARRSISSVLPLQESPYPWESSLSASRDGRTLFYTQWNPQSVIKVMENFR